MTWRHSLLRLNRLRGIVFQLALDFSLVRGVHGIVHERYRDSHFRLQVLPLLLVVPWDDFDSHRDYTFCPIGDRHHPLDVAIVSAIWERIGLDLARLVQPHLGDVPL